MRGRVKFAPGCNCIANLFGLYVTEKHVANVCAEMRRNARPELSAKLNYIDLAKWNFLIILFRRSRIMRKRG